MNESAASPSYLIVDLLECPVCLELIYPPIFQCSNGHTLCSNCKHTVQNKCPTCRTEMGEIRNLALENLLQYVKSPCVYSSNGCTKIIKYLAKSKHEKSCRFRPYKCPFPCLVKGDVPTLINHLRDDHKLNYENTDLINMEYQVQRSTASASFSIYKYYDHYFCLHFEAFSLAKSLVFMVYLTFMGEAMDATNYHYCLEISNGKRKMTWQGIPRSTRETTEKIRESGDGLTIPQAVAKNFFERNCSQEQVLQVKGRICNDGRSRQSYLIFSDAYLAISYAYSTIRDCLNKFLDDEIVVVSYSTAKDLMLGCVSVGFGAIFVFGFARLGDYMRCRLGIV